jgi:hypothetical protein
VAARTHRPPGKGRTDSPQRRGKPVHLDPLHRYTDTLALEGLKPSIGSVGDAYDSAAAETVMGLFKSEAIAKDSPFRAGVLKTETDVMEIVFEWVHWYNNERLHSALDHQTPEEYEQTYYDLQTGPSPDDAANKQAHDSRDGSDCPAIVGAPNLLGQHASAVVPEPGSSQSADDVRQDRRVQISLKTT